MSALASLIVLALAAEPVKLPLSNGDFEQQAAGWTIRDSMSSLSEEQAASGRWSLKVVDEREDAGSDVVATNVPVEPGIYELRGKVYPVSGSGLGIYVRVLDAAGAIIGRGDEFQRGAPTAPVGQWVPFTLTVYVTGDARALQLWIHSYGAAKVAAYLDDFELWRVGGLELVPPPWPAQYKLRPDETERLTAADVVGPDGLVYPDWSRAGIRGGIPDVPVKARAAEYGALPDDDRDDSEGILAAVAQAAAAGGGAVLLEPGLYHLDRPILIRDDGIVLRGAGRDRTKILFRYQLGPDQIRFPEPLADELYTDSTVTLHAGPEGLQNIAVRVGDQTVAESKRGAHSGNYFNVSVPASRILAAVDPNATEVTVVGVATYADGRVRELSRRLTIHRRNGDPGALRRVGMEVAIGFGGTMYAGPRILLAEDGRRGDTKLVLADASGFRPGDRVVIEGPATDRWKALTQNACKWGSYRRNMLEIAAIDGNVVTITEPLRIEFPVVDGSFVQKVVPIERCGIEDLTIEQTENLWITTVLFRCAWECWARGVTVVKCGRMPIYGSTAKHCVIADCVFDDAWFKGGGGTAYAGWEFSYDCLMTDCTTYKLRHAPCVQWSASGNVIRRSTFVDSDMQWHSGWTNENLFEQCTVIANTGNGAYGYGAWASPPEDDAHGPNGPRNVVYNCDLRSPRTGLWMGGMNEAWMILYNRFVVESGPGIFAKTFSFDHILRGNVLAVKDARQPGIWLATPDCTGVEILDNRLYGGNGTICAGLGVPAVEEGNQALTYEDSPPRPEPPVPSIYEWQLARSR